MMMIWDYLRALYDPPVCDALGIHPSRAVISLRPGLGRSHIRIYLRGLITLKTENGLFYAY